MEKLTKVFMLFVCTLVIFSYFYLKDAGISQNQHFDDKYKIYNTALNQIKEKESQKAIKSFDDLIVMNPSNYLFHRYIGYSYALENNFEKAIYHYENALHFNPYIVENQLFMLQFAEITYVSNEHIKTNLIVNRILASSKNEKILQKAKQIQKQIPVD